MDYDAFRRVWNEELAQSRLLVFPSANETLDLRSMERSYSTFVEPAGGQGAEPFHVSAKLSWRWDALQTARAATTEDDMLGQLLGREQVDDIETERPWLRVDIVLHASLPWGKPVPLPPSAALAAWVTETMARLAHVEPLVGKDQVREADKGSLQVLAWKDEPKLKVACSDGGRLMLEGVDLAAWQSIELPREWDNPDRERDPEPDAQLRALFARVRASIQAWMEATDHLLPRTRSMH